jgi:hypothetical protein
MKLSFGVNQTTPTNAQFCNKLNCASTRFTKEQADQLFVEVPGFWLSRDKAWYKIYYPNKNSSECYLRQMGGTKTIK